MKYVVHYDKYKSIDKMASMKITFDASSDRNAADKASGLVKKAERAFNQNIANPFYHWTFVKTGLYKVKQDEVLIPVTA